MTCKNKYNILCCPYCKGPNYPITEKGKCSNNLCLYCNNVFKVNDCSTFNHISRCCCSPGVKHKCGFCKTETANNNVNDKNKLNNNVVNTKQMPNLLSSSMKGSSLGSGGNEDKEKFICKVCFDKPINMIFINCGHVCVCFDCYSALKKKELQSRRWV